MITNIHNEIDRGRIYAIITRDSIAEGEQIAIDVAGKRFYKYLPNAGESVRIDITPYCASALRDMGDVLNALSANNKVYGVAEGVATIPDINQERGGVLFFKNVASHSNPLLTKLPTLQMSEGCSLYVAMKVTDDYNEQLSCGNVTISIIGNGDIEDLCIVRIRPTSAANSLTLTDNMGYGGANLPIRNVPSGMNTRRLVWLNEVGGIDSWSFEFLRESSLSTSSEVFYTSTKGYTRINRQYERQHVVETRELDDLTADVVAYVIASPEVYLEENGKLVPIDIVTESSRTYSDTELTTIQVAYRLRERERV